MGDVVNLSDYRKRLKRRVKNRKANAADNGPNADNQKSAPAATRDREPKSGPRRVTKKGAKTTATAGRESARDDPPEAG